MIKEEAKVRREKARKKWNEYCRDRYWNRGGRQDAKASYKRKVQEAKVLREKATEPCQSAGEKAKELKQKMIKDEATVRRQNLTAPRESGGCFAR